MADWSPPADEREDTPGNSVKPTVAWSPPANERDVAVPIKEPPSITMGRRGGTSREATQSFGQNQQAPGFRAEHPSELAAIAGLGKGITAGVSPYITAGMAYGVEKLRGQPTSYQDALNASRSVNAGLQEQSPYAYGGGQLLGGIGLGPLVGAGKTFGSLVGTGAGIGTISGASDVPYTNLGDLALRAGKGAALGGLVGGVAGGLQVGSNAVKAAFKDAYARNLKTPVDNAVSAYEAAINKFKGSYFGIPAKASTADIVKKAKDIIATQPNSMQATQAAEVLAAKKAVTSSRTTFTKAMPKTEEDLAKAIKFTIQENNPYVGLPLGRMAEGAFDMGGVGLLSGEPSTALLLGAAKAAQPEITANLRSLGARSASGYSNIPFGKIGTGLLGGTEAATNSNITLPPVVVSGKATPEIEDPAMAEARQRQYTEFIRRMKTGTASERAQAKKEYDAWIGTD